MWHMPSVFDQIGLQSSLMMQAGCCNNQHKTVAYNRTGASKEGVPLSGRILGAKDQPCHRRPPPHLLHAIQFPKSFAGATRSRSQPFGASGAALISAHREL